LTNLVLIILCSLILLSIVQVILILIYSSNFKNSKDEYVIDLSTLERIIDDYANTVSNKRIQQTKKNYNLDSESKINSILAFEKKSNDITNCTKHHSNTTNNSSNYFAN